MRYFSKTHFLQFLQCPKLAWTSLNRPEDIAPNSPSTESRMQQGLLVEEYARQLFPNALVIAHDQPLDEIIAQSNDALLRPSEFAICNALLNAGELIAETDIMVPVDDGFDLFEVKSSTNAKPEHLPDIAFQKHVAERMGVKIRNCCLVLINSKYVRHGDIKPKQLFTIVDVTEGVQEYGEVEAQVNNALLTCQQETCPSTEIGEQCTSDCPLRNICWADVDEKENNIFSLYRLPSKRAWGWYRDGITTNDRIPADYPLNERQKIQVKAEKTGQLHVNKRRVREFLTRLQFPAYFLDFETFASPIPLIDNTHPYEQMPFQFSLHVSEKNLNDEPTHYSWIWNGEGDPRAELLSRLQSLLGNKGSIVAYNAVFEKGILKSAAKKHPRYQKWLDGVLERFVDLLVPFRSFHLYHPNQHGSCSLKSVLPALVGRSYDGLEISDGEMASREYMRILRGEVKADEADKIRANLEIYCGQDTMAMIEIMRKMKGLVER